jgi:hypothetical protein
MQSGNSVLCLLSSPFLYAIFGTFIIGTKLRKIADIQEFTRLKTIKLSDNKTVATNAKFEHPDYVTLSSRTVSPQAVQELLISGGFLADFD